MGSSVKSDFFSTICLQKPARKGPVDCKAGTTTIHVGRNALLPGTFPCWSRPIWERKGIWYPEYNLQVGLKTRPLNPLHLACFATSAHLLSGGVLSDLASPLQDNPLFCFTTPLLLHRPNIGRTSFDTWSSHSIGITCFLLQACNQGRTTGVGLGRFALGQLAHQLFAFSKSVTFRGLLCFYKGFPSWVNTTHNKSTHWIVRRMIIKSNTLKAFYKYSKEAHNLQQTLGLLPKSFDYSPTLLTKRSVVS